MNTTANTSPVAAVPRAASNEHLDSIPPEAPPTYEITPERIASLRATFEAAAVLPDEELHKFLEGFREAILHEYLPWMGEVIGREIRDLSSVKYRVGWRKGLTFGIPIGIPIGSLLALLAVAAGMHWAAA